MKYTYLIEGMNSAGCADNVKKVLLQRPEIKSAEVTFEPPQAEIVLRNHINTDDLRVVVEKAGKFSLEKVIENI